jgi:hypothetical protein
MTIAADRYLKVILTVIAIELLWIGVRDMAPPVAAQGAGRVVIAGIDLADDAALPVAVVGSYETIPFRLRTRVQNSLMPLTTRIQGPVTVK